MKKLNLRKETVELLQVSSRFVGGDLRTAFCGNTVMMCIGSGDCITVLPQPASDMDIYCDPPDYRTKVPACESAYDRCPSQGCQSAVCRPTEFNCKN